MTESLHEPAEDPDWEPVGKTARRPDGTVVELLINRSGFLLVNDTSSDGSTLAQIGYTWSDVTVLGKGDHERGLIEIGRRHFEAGHANALTINIGVQDRLNAHYQ